MNTKEKFWENLFLELVLPIRVRRINMFFGPSGSISTRYGSGSFYHQAKIVRMIPAVFRRLHDFLSMKNDVGSCSQRHGSADPDPYQNVTDPQHCLCLTRRVVLKIVYKILHSSLLQYLFITSFVDSRKITANFENPSWASTHISFLPPSFYQFQLLIGWRKNPSKYRSVHGRTRLPEGAFWVIGSLRGLL